ncbi:MAG: GNAT family N-acetyltransferase [Spirochaetes bacterium]|nr:GNAT family N-acetyltransferase [Spirochaetota bacterium]
MIRPCNEDDFSTIYQIINDAATAYKGIIPADRWHEPYMSETELREQISDGVVFSCYTDNDEIIGVMGIQDKDVVKLIRHAYVRTVKRNKGIGGILLRHLISSSDKPVLIGTWKDAVWAIGFYQKNGFSLVDEKSKNLLLKKFWGVPERQIETSVVLSDGKYDLNSL